MQSGAAYQLPILSIIQQDPTLYHLPTQFQEVWCLACFGLDKTVHDAVVVANCGLDSRSSIIIIIL